MTYTRQLSDTSERFRSIGFAPVQVPNYLAETLAKLSEDERSRVGGWRVALSPSGDGNVLLCILPHDFAAACVSGDRDTRDAAHAVWIDAARLFFERRPLADGFRVLMQFPEAGE